MTGRHVVIAGGGASGLLLARSLVRAGVRTTILEPHERLGAGIAYATSCPSHVLNVPAAKMSAFADEPCHFVDWLVANGYTDDPLAFVPRMVYGTYLQSIARTMQADGDLFSHVRARATDAEPVADGVRVTLAGETHIEASAFVVAVGNANPSPWPRVPDAVLSSSHFFNSAWIDGATVPVTPDERVVLLGTGLTAVDAVLALRHHGHTGRIVMVSRRGLLPHEHRLFDSPPALSRDAKTIADVIAAARDAQRNPDTDWRLTIDGLRSETNDRWVALDLSEQRRFVRHVLPYWNVHRHRMAPQAARSIAGLAASGTLRMLAGRTGPLEVTPDGVRVPVALRGGEAIETIVADRVINCSGPEHDVAKRRNPLLARLLERGWLSPHPLRIGARIARNGALIDAAGVPSARMFAIGPVRYGTLIETTAIPEIREQARELAFTILEGEITALRQAGRSSRT